MSEERSFTLQLKQDGTGKTERVTVTQAGKEEAPGVEYKFALDLQKSGLDSESGPIHLYSGGGVGSMYSPSKTLYVISQKVEDGEVVSPVPFSAHIEPYTEELRCEVSSVASTVTVSIAGSTGSSPMPGSPGKIATLVISQGGDSPGLRPLRIEVMYQIGN